MMRCELRFLGVVSDVLQTSVKVLFVANDAVVAFFLPERPFAADVGMYVVGAILLPTLENRFQRLLAPIEGPQNRVDVVGHDHIRPEFVALIVEMMHGSNDVAALRLVSQHAVSESLIEPDLGVSGQLFGKLLQRGIGLGRRILSLPIATNAG